MYDKKTKMQSSPIGTRIRELRLSRGWSLAELASRAGTSAPTLHRYENGWDRFELNTLRKIASALGLSLEIRFINRQRISGELPKRSPARLRKLFAPLFWDRELRTKDLDNYPGWILERVLMFGNIEQVKAARRFYGDELLTRAASRRGVDPRTRNFWKVISNGVENASEGTQ